MAREIERTAATVDEAVAAALEWLGAEAEDVDIEVLREPDPERAEAIVRVRLRGEGDDELSEPAPAPSPGLDELEEQADAVADFVDELLAKMDIDAIAEPNPQGGHMYVDIVDGPEDDMALLIGRHGQMIDALQYLANAIAHRAVGEERRRIVVDAAGYRARRSATLEGLARRSAERASAAGQRVELDAMSAVERRIVHEALKDDPEVSTVSEGTEPNRYVVVVPRRSAD